jgi:ketosteroid isomerase-like protein
MARLRAHATVGRAKEDLMDRSRFQQWLDHYVAAWQSYDEAAIRDLFSEDAEYRYHPWDAEAVRGREAIASDWVENRDAPGSWRASYSATACDDGLCVATGTSDYLTEDRSAVDRTYYNAFFCLFDDAGRCSSFTEYYMQAPGAAAQSSTTS